MSRLLAPIRLIVCLLALATPAIVQAQTTTTTFGGSSNTGSGTYRLKQNRYTVTQDAVLDSADFYFGCSGSVTVGVWEQTNSTGTYTNVFQQSLSIGSTSRTWRTMGNMNVPLTAGNSYLVGVWIGGTTGYYSYSSTSSYPSTSWGTQSSWADTSASSFPSTQSSTVAGSNSSGGYYQRLTVTIAGDADGDGFSVAQGDCDDTSATVWPGAPETCDDAIDQDCDGVDEIADFDGDTYDSIICGGTDCDDTDASLSPGIDADLDGFNSCVDCDDGNVTINPTVDGDGDGANVCDDCDDADPTSYPGAVELCDGLDNDCDGAAGNAGTYESAPDTNSQSGTGYFRGGKFQASTTTTLSSIEADLTIASGSTLTWGIYEATSQTGTYTLLTTNSTVSATSARAWHVSAPMGTTLTTGRWYVMGVIWSAATSATVYYRSSTNATFPYATSWGTHEGGASSNSFAGVLPASNSFSTSATSYNIRVNAGSVNENDADGDSSLACSGDCDDNNAATYPAAAEICDGLDNDCDGAVPATETDGDGDGSLGCVDCDDANATVYPGAPELCDNLDNDCDGNGDGVDVDVDGYLACNDCDDNNALTYPGATEQCDGEDNDCDGNLGTGSGTGIPVLYEFNGSTSFTGSSMYRGGMFLASQDVTVTELAVELSSSSVTFRIFEGTSTSGTFTEIGSAAYASSSGSWRTSGAMNVPLQAGMYYAIFGQWSSSATYYRSTLTSSQNPTWGDQLGYAAGSGAPSTSSTIANSTGYGYSLRVTTVDGGGNDEIDADGDGFLACAECDDADATVMPGGPELCNGLDDNCDNVVPADEFDADGDGQTGCAGDCDDADATTYTGASEICDLVDNDCDGVVPATESDGDGDGEPGCTDCDDTEATVYTGAPELCDGLDNNCDSTVPLDEIDNDGDGFDECGGGDCDDASTSIYPGAPELCDGLDNDCNFAVPANEDDDDSDGQLVCAGDCDDLNAAIYTGAPEICDALDNDCDGVVPSTETDADGDGVPTCANDCDDNDPLTYPGAVEQCDGLDNDCNGNVPGAENDNDGDGYRICDDDCNDNSAAINPGATEDCNGLDDDCDGAPDADAAGEVDLDFDGSRSCEDCDDFDADAFPGNNEVCDGQDNDCNGSADFDAAGEVDADSDGWLSCLECDDTNNQTWPGAPEICDQQDNNCDGNLPFDEEDDDADGMASCEGDCDDTDADTYDGAPEICDEIDNDCDGTTEDEAEDLDGDGFTPCDGDCDDTSDLTSPFADEICDGEDNDCNEQVPDDESDLDADGWMECEGDCEDEEAEVNPDAFEDTEELCNDGLDNDCDGDRDRREEDCDGLYNGGDDDDSTADGGGRGTCACDNAAPIDSDALALFALVSLLGGLGRRRRA